MRNISGIISLFILLKITPALFSQSISTIPICQLSQDVSETSGLVWINNELWTHNDSGEEPILYQIDTLTGNVIHTVFIGNASNFDWEDICHDETYIYIGDFGNNFGNRTDLKIYRIKKTDLHSASPEITADTIMFHYPNQTQFEWDSYTTNFDAEAFIATNDSLYIFSKNWGNHKTYLYALPKTPGTFPAHLKDSLNINGLVTGAAYNPTQNKVLLIGYAPYLSSSFIQILDNFIDDDFFGGTGIQINLSLILHQVEGIDFLRETEFIFSYESYGTVKAGLRRGNFNEILSTLETLSNNSTPYLFPNPAQKQINIENCKLYNTVRIYNLNGEIMLEKAINSDSSKINIQCFKPGVYSIEFTSPYRRYTDVIVVN